MTLCHAPWLVSIAIGPRELQDNVSVNLRMKPNAWVAVGLNSHDVPLLPHVRNRCLKKCLVEHKLIITKMPEKEMSHQESALLFINNLQNELAKESSTAQGQCSQTDSTKMPPPQQIRRLQNPRGETQSEHSLEYC